MKQYNILFLCTHNSARSIIGEALASTHSSRRLIGYSAGSSPASEVHPLARELTASLGYPSEKLRSKNWSEFAAPDAPKMDFIITVCDKAAGEVCPVWPGNPVTAHWGFPDPVQVEGSEEEKRKAFLQIMQGLLRRIDALAALPLERLDHLSLQNEVRRLAAT